MSWRSKTAYGYFVDLYHTAYDQIWAARYRLPKTKLLPYTSLLIVIATDILRGASLHYI